MATTQQSFEKLVRKLTLFTLLFIICIGLVLVFVPIQPFWVDEWFIISSLKTKNIAQIFGQLNFMQQFPRVYLALVKVFTHFFNYSYFSLRFPSFVVSMSTIVLGYRVLNKLFGRDSFLRYLFVLIIVSSFTFTEYFVEMKQYPMDIFASVLAIWQLIELLEISRDNNVKVRRYLFLCAGFLIAPCFSYTYPIAIAPAYIVVLLQTIAIFKSGQPLTKKKRITITQWVPLLIGLIGMALFYFIDAKQLATDRIMHDRWSFLMLDSDHKFVSFCSGFYSLFSQTGNGIVFENIFGVLGICGFILGVVSGAKGILEREYSLELQLRIYSSLVIILTLLLYVAKKLPLGTPRLNAFTTPSIAILVIYLLGWVSKSRQQWQQLALPALLYLGVAGNVFTHFIGYFTAPEYHRRMKTYVATENAIILAQDKKLPILITTGVAFPYEQAAADAGAPDPAVWVLKTFPAYNIHEQLAVYPLRDTGDANAYLAQLPVGTDKVLAGDGISFHIIDRN